MNRKITYLSILAIPLLLLLTAPALFNYSEASSIQTTYQYGIRTSTVVCGDHLCNEHKTVSAVSRDAVVMGSPVLHEHLPKIEVLEAHNFSNSDPNSYIVTLKITSGKQNLENISLKVVSDTETTGSNIGGLFAEKSTKVIVRTTAMDPSSIHASVISYQLRD